MWKGTEYRKLAGKKLGKKIVRKNKRGGEEKQGGKQELEQIN